MTPVTAESLEPHVEALAAGLRRARARVLGLLADNGAQWLAADLAAERAGIPLVPLPGFFSPQQLQHAVRASGMDALLGAPADLARSLGFMPAAALPGTGLSWFRRDAAPVELPAGTRKVTFTSGTTGTPKGVCLGAAQQEALAAALAEATRALGIERHLALLPLAVLLENVAGARAALHAGAACFLPPLEEAGVGGAARFDPRACLAALERSRAHSVILLPQMMAALTAVLEHGAKPPASLRFAAVGGAKVAPALLARARKAGLPVYEGYGLSECASVVALNRPGADRPGSVGRPLPHVRIRVDAGGEITVEGSAYLGYLGEAARAPGVVRTGDLGFLDGDGFLHVDGRRKNVLITSFGRNVAPEWPEAELCARGVVAQAVVFGEARPKLSALLVPSPGHGDEALAAEVARANAALPDYARIAFWERADAPFSAADGSATENGRPRRDVLWARYGARIESRYSQLPGAEHGFL